MARKRMLDPTIWADEKFAKLSDQAKVLFIGIISNADDEGRLPGNSLYLTSTIFPYEGITKQKANNLLDEVVSSMKSVVLYEVDGSKYIQLVKWNDYQSINRPTSSKYPPLTEDSLRTHGGLTPNRIEKNRIEKKRIEKKRKEKKTASYEKDHKEWLRAFNLKANTKFQSTATLKNYRYWREQGYTKRQMLEALETMKQHDWLSDKLKPELLLRRTDTHKNPVDRIGELLSIKKITYL